MPKAIKFYKYRPHPWHGLSPGKNPPRHLQAYIEITSFDGVKYEIDKETGYLRVDRPQLTSSLPPAAYGFVPRTFCGDRVGKIAGVPDGDHDPLDICVISERDIARAEVLLNAKVIGGLRTIDHDQADDKIIAVLENDPTWAYVNDIHRLPDSLVSRIQHYFATYKLVPGQPGSNSVKVSAIYGVEQAELVVKAALDDYAEIYEHVDGP